MFKYKIIKKAIGYELANFCFNYFFIISIILHLHLHPIAIFLFSIYYPAPVQNFSVSFVQNFSIFFISNPISVQITRSLSRLPDLCPDYEIT